MSAFYDSYDYPVFWADRHYEDKSERLALGKLFKTFSERKTLIDIGGGFGRLAGFYAPIFESCTILEPSEKMIEKGKENLKNLKNVAFVKGSFPSLPLKDNSFDVALMIRVLHHLNSSLMPIKEVYRILKPKGYFILEIANKIHFWARIKAFFRGDFSYSTNLIPIDRRSRKSIAEGKILFVDHHPRQIINDLVCGGFSVCRILSVSNFRSPFLKKTVPEKLLLKFEGFLQLPLGKKFFGPSIFVLAQKNVDSEIFLNL